MSMKDLFEKSDYINFMMKKHDMLNHIPAKVYSKLEELKVKQGSAANLAKKIGLSVSNKARMEKFQGKIKPQFNVPQTVEKASEKCASELIEAILGSQKEQTFEQFQGLCKGILERGIGEMVDNLEGGFEGGKENVWGFIRESLSDFNT
mmetsp:Transcript_4681/g.7966  ORF Transcript_4681/g.7966 Transcript_4681/m.7966 type:complete len:149 (+) Transcript_4681:1396-1842(+)